MTSGKSFSPTGLNPCLNERERSAFVSPAPRTCSEWADDVRKLPSGRKWKTDRTPYLRGVLDSFNAREVEEVCLKKSTQVGGTEALLNIIGYCIDQVPQDVLVIQPIKDLAESFGKERILPMIERTPALRKRKSARKWDVKKWVIRMSGCNVHLTGSESPATLAGRALGIVIGDEMDKWAQASGKESSPGKLAWERTRTFKGRRKFFKVSTPTNKFGYIHLAFEESLKHRFFCPCPHCGKHQHLNFRRIKWPSGYDAATIENEQNAYYECEACFSPITEAEKTTMISRGYWVPEGGNLPPTDFKEAAELRELLKPGSRFCSGDVPPSKRWGFHLNALYSPWLTWSDIAAEFLKSKDDPITLKNFVNSWLGEVYEEKRQSIKSKQIRRLIEDHWIMGDLPEGVDLITAAVDVQSTHFWVLIEGWGYNEESWVLGFEKTESWTNVGLALDRVFQRKDCRLQVELAAIDSGNWAQDVYDFCERNPALYIPIKGRRSLGGPMFRKYHAEIDPETGKPERNGLVLWTLDTNRIKDRLMSRIVSADPQKIHLPRDIPEDFLLHLTSESKVQERQETVWKPASEGTPNHGWDCLVYSYLAMRILGQHRREEPPPQKEKPPPKRAKGGGQSHTWVSPNRKWV